MKLSSKNPDRASKVFVLFLWLEYLMDTGEPVIGELRKIRNELVAKYGTEISELTVDVIHNAVKCSAKCVMSLEESYSRIPSSHLTVVSEFYRRHGMDKINLQEYVVQNMERHNHVGLIPMVLSNLDRIDEIVEESVRRYESGIKYGDKPDYKPRSVSEGARIVQMRQDELYNSIAEDLR